MAKRFRGKETCKQNTGKTLINVAVPKRSAPLRLEKQKSLTESEKPNFVRNFFVEMSLCIPLYFV